MNTATDQELLQDYAQNGSEKAFTELVRRHVNFVYSIAKRVSADEALAQDATQKTFIALAKASKNFTKKVVLSGWLHQTTRNITANLVRTEVRRRSHEQEAATMNEIANS